MPLNIQPNSTQAPTKQRSVETTPSTSKFKSHFWHILGFISVLIVSIVFGFNVSTLIAWVNSSDPFAFRNLEINIACYLALAGFVIFEWITDFFDKDTDNTGHLLRVHRPQRKDSSIPILLVVLGLLSIFSWTGLVFDKFTTPALSINAIVWLLVFIFLTFIMYEISEYNILARKHGQGKTQDK